MRERVDRITEEVRKIDAKLYAVRASNGMIQIYRKADRIEASDFNQNEGHPSHAFPQFILALTDTWKLQGTPVDWGLEPLMVTLRGMDSWKHDIYSQVLKNRAREKETREQSFKNEVRARAADLRKDFAKATNDINTSSLSA